MKNVFITSGPITWASARLRAFWPAKYMPETDVIQVEHVAELPEYDNYVFQKRIDLDMMESLHAHGKRIYWDYCDPLHWWQPDVCRKVARICEAVVCSNQALADDFNAWYGDDKAVCIPDCLEPEHFPKKRVHAEVTPVRFVWYGLAVNRVALFAGLVNLERLAANGYKIELTIMDDRPDQSWRVTDYFPISHIQWRLEQENEIIANHDIAFLPPYPGPWGQVKSNNKILTAWACGLPVVSTHEYNDYETLMDWQCRRNWQTLINIERINMDVRQSAAEWMGLFNV